MKSFFPFTLMVLNSNTSKGDSRFRPAFHLVRQKNTPWYVYDVVVLSKDRVRFEVYDMADNVYGGVGGKLYDVECAVGMDVMEEVLAERAQELAKLKREQDLRDEEKRIIDALAEDILASENLLGAMRRPD